MLPPIDEGLWPDAQSVASWPEMAAGCAAAPTVNCCSMTPRTHINGAPLRPSLMELQRMRAASTPVDVADGASLLGVARRRRPVRTAATYCAAFAMATLLVAVGGVIALTMLEHPPWPLALDSPTWLTAWLIATLAEAGGASLCLCAIVAASERPCQAAFWMALCLVGGSLGMCTYLLVRLLRHGTLRLATSR